MEQLSHRRRYRAAAAPAVAVPLENGRAHVCAVRLQVAPGVVPLYRHGLCLPRAQSARLLSSKRLLAETHLAL